jgi:hypothetical protein
VSLTSGHSQGHVISNTPSAREYRAHEDGPADFIGLPNWQTVTIVLKLSVLSDLATLPEMQQIYAVLPHPIVKTQVAAI